MSTANDYSQVKKLKYLSSMANAFAVQKARISGLPMASRLEDAIKGTMHYLDYNARASELF